MWFHSHTTIVPLHKQDDDTAAEKEIAAVTEPTPSKIPTIIATVYLIVVVPILGMAIKQAFADQV